MAKSGLIVGLGMLVLALVITLVSPVCGPCVAILTGLGAGYLAGIFVKPLETSAAAKSGAAAGAISGVGGLIGQMIGGVINAVFLGPEQALAILRGLLGLPADLGSRAPNTYYYLGALGIPCCVGLFDIALMASLGALGGLLWRRLSKSHVAPIGPTADQRATQAPVTIAYDSSERLGQAVVEAPKPAGSAAMSTRTFFSEDWNFSIVYPADWDIVWQNEPAGSWMIPIAVAGKDTGRGRPCFMVNARRGEILQGSSSVRVYAWGDGTPTEMPSTPQEYIEMNKKTLGREFSGYQFIAAEESRLANKPAARLLYSYEGNKGRITEESITLFGVGVTFQFICESPASKYDEYRPCFQSILESFRIGRDSPAEAAIVESGSDTTSADQSPEQLYNKATSLYRNGEFEQAMQAFDQCFRSGEYQMLAAYARCLCQRELGLEIEIPQELGDQAETAGVVYVASNLACHLIAQGHQAALTKQDGTSEVRANIGGSLYLIHISSLLGAFLNMAWRQEEDKNIPVADRSVNPNPTEADKFVESLLEKASSLPPSPLPKGGLRTTLE